jgi:hypothetical protein
MPYKQIAPGIRLWFGKMTKAQELESITRASGVRMFPSANSRAQAPAAATPATDSAPVGELQPQRPAK